MRRWYLAVLVTALAACEQAPPIALTDPGPDPDASRIPVATGEDESLALVARVIAAGLDPDGARLDLIQLLRQSPYSAHKVFLHEYLAMPAGQTALATGLRETGVSKSAFQQALARLPRMDFFVPYREHRKTWTGNGEVGVVALLDTDADVSPVVFTNGEEGAYFPADGAPEYTVVMMHPADRRVRRLAPQPMRPGTVIQDEDDGELAVVYETVDRSGAIREMNAAALLGLLEDCDPETSIEPCDGGSGGGGGGTAPADTTYLDYFEPYFTDAGDLDIKFKIWYYSSGQLSSYSTAYFGDVCKCATYPHWSLVFERMDPATSDSMKIEVWELDALGDDHEARRVFHPVDRGQIRTAFKPGTTTPGADIELDWTPVN